MWHYNLYLSAQRAFSEFYMRRLLFSLFLSIPLIISSCAGQSRTGSEEPGWLSTPPADEEYYFGIGGSDTGNEADDREIAMARAQSDLAASISVDIISELRLEEKASSTGESSETLESRITQTVSQSLVSLETLDSWYNPDRGYWILVRMEKSVWEEQRATDRRMSVPPPGGLDINSGLNIPFLSILSGKNLPFQLLPGGRNTPFELSLDWVVSDFPALDETGGIFFSSLTGVVSFRQYGVVLFTREYGPYKEGGLSYDQARERGALKILDEFRRDGSFATDLTGALR